MDTLRARIAELERERDEARAALEGMLHLADGRWLVTKEEHLVLQEARAALAGKAGEE